MVYSIKIIYKIVMSSHRKSSYTVVKVVMILIEVLFFKIRPGFSVILYDLMKLFDLRKSYVQLFSIRL